MSLPLVVCASGITGVFVVMFFLQIMVALSSKLALSMEKKAE
jgi:hypothetical protein